MERLRSLPLLALATGGFGLGVTEFAIMGILPQVAESLGITIPQAGHAISLYACGVVVGAPLFAVHGKRIAAHKALVYLMIWFTVFNSLCAFATSYPMLLLLRFLSGLPHGAFFGLGAVVATKLVAPEQAAQATAVMFGGLTVANVIGVPAGTYIGQTIGWQSTFLLVGCTGVAAVTALRSWLPELDTTQSSDNAGGAIWRRAEFWMILLLTVIGTGGFFAWYSYIAPNIIDVAGMPEWTVTPILVLAGIGMTIGNFLGAKLADDSSPLQASGVFLCGIVVTLIAFYLTSHLKPAMILLSFVMGTLAFCIVTPVQMLMIRSCQGSEMLGSAINQSAFNIGNALGAFLGGLPIAAGYGIASSNLVGAVLAGCGACMVVVIYFYRKQRTKPINSPVCPNCV